MRALGIAAALIVTGQVFAASDLVIPLKFIPTTKPGAVTAQLREGMSSRSIAIEVEDARGMKSVDLVGEGTADNDSMFKIRATGHVPSFVKATMKDRLSAWGAVVEDKSPLVLAIRASRFFVRESNMVFGSTYQAEIQLPWVLRDRAGHVFAEGAAGGTAQQKGRKHNAANCGEVLSNAFEQAAAQLANNASLQEAWVAAKPQAAQAPAVAAKANAPASGAGKTPADLLKEVNKLRSQQLGTNVLVAY
ncbi:MAG TPA: hypothetical protein VJ826_07595, partial [Candidatus Polarisedimenticolaceae bacterium]|nr:hypothetical protein [Candidatus Polarisedimenticolaceae bacterium]